MQDKIRNIKTANNTSFENVSFFKYVGMTQINISCAKNLRTD